MTIGDIPMPVGFRYKKIYDRGKPQHTNTDPFRIRHPSMAVSRRAKIFAPFDALKGFNEAVTAKDEIYVNRRELSEEDLKELNYRMAILCRFASDSRTAKQNRVQVSVTYFVPRTDINSEAYGVRGQYRTVTGTCMKVDYNVSQSILIDNKLIRFRDICDIRFPDQSTSFSSPRFCARKETQEHTRFPE